MFQSYAQLRSNPHYILSIVKYSASVQLSICGSLAKFNMPIVGPSPSPNTDAPQQRSQPSRKGKRAWRKNVDLTDVVKGLEELNDEIIHGFVVLHAIPPPNWSSCH